MSEQNRWKIPQKLGDWVAEMTWAEGDIQGGPSMLVIQPADPDNVPAGGLSSTVLRAVDFRTAAATLHEAMSESAAVLEQIRERQRKGPKLIDRVREALESEGLRTTIWRCWWSGMSRSSTQAKKSRWTTWRTSWVGRWRQ
jgi:hypothetical protein